MKKVLFCLLTVLCTSLYLYFTDEKISINQEDIIQAQNVNTIENLELKFQEIKKTIPIPVDPRRSYLLDEKKLEEYKRLLRQ